LSIEPQRITVEEDGRMLAEALVRADPPSVHADFHVESGQLPVGTRTRLVDAVLDDSSGEDAAELTATLPAGDGEILNRLRERCDDLQLRAAGASTLATGAIPKS
jgi:hypothetical protein